MTLEEFDNMVRQRVDALKETSQIKGMKYTEGSEDRLTNFKMLEPRVSRLVVWEVYFKKHLSAIDYFLKTGENIGEDICDAHIHDCIMYLLLLEGLIKDKNHETAQKDFDKDTNTLVRCVNCDLVFPVEKYDTLRQVYCPKCKFNVYVDKMPVDISSKVNVRGLLYGHTFEVENFNKFSAYVCPICNIKVNVNKLS